MVSIRVIGWSAISYALVACAQNTTFSESGGPVPDPTNRAVVSGLASSNTGQASDVIQDVGSTVTVSGRVTASNGSPIVDAEISIPGVDHTARTGTDGKYALNNVPAGPSTILVSHTGYASSRAQAKLSTKSSDRQRNHVDVTLLTPDEASDLVERASRDSAFLARVGFLQRSVSNHDAYFVTPDQIAAMHPRVIADLFRHVPVLLDSPAPRGLQSRGAAGCNMTYVNGILRNSTYRNNIDTYVRAQEVIGVEVYPPGQFPPAPFNRGATQTACTTVGIWTRS